MDVRITPHDGSPEPIMQFSAGRWWLGTPPNGWPPIRRQRFGNQLHRWTLWIRLLGHRELEVCGRPIGSAA